MASRWPTPENRGRLSRIVVVRARSGTPVPLRLANSCKPPVANAPGELSSSCGRERALLTAGASSLASPGRDHDSKLPSECGYRTHQGSQFEVLDAA